jgi:hypothetical protein
MESINHTLFLWLNAPEHPSALALTLATFFGEQLIWAVPLLIGIGWLRGSEGNRKAMLVVTASGLLGLLINQAIGLVWTHPRPFMIGLGHTLIPHVADSLRIPPKLDTRSAANWTLIPAQTGHLFQHKLDTWDVTARGRGSGFTPDGPYLSNRHVFYAANLLSN